MADAPKPYGDVKYADPEDGKYPIDTEEHCRAAWSYVNMPKNAAALGDKLGAVKARIRAACKKFGIDISDDGGRSAESNEIERRNTIFTVEVRATNAHGNGRDIGGYAAVFDKRSKMMVGTRGAYTEDIATCFFNKSRADGWPGAGSGVVCRFNHEDNMLLGTTRSGTLNLGVDNIGLDYSVDCPHCREDVFEMVGRRDISQSSFAFMAIDQDWVYDQAGGTQRHLIEGRLIDVAPVTQPAYEDTSVGLRNLAAQKGVPIEDVEKMAAQEELRKLFVRTDLGGVPERRRPLSGAKARMYMRGKRPIDPFKRG